MRERLMEDFSAPEFQRAFQEYFQEMGVQVEDWPGLFREMNGDGRGNRAYVWMDGDRAAGFIQFCPVELACWFFSKKAGFVREFWVAPEHRGKGLGSRLLALAENWCQEQGAAIMLLTTDTAAGFYEKRGYRRDPGFAAKNGDAVYVKEL